MSSAIRPSCRPHIGDRTLAAVLVLVAAGASMAGEFSELKTWDDGLSEMCYYAATDKIYGTQQNYTRVHLFNRQWMDPESGVKTEPDAEGAVAVFKLVIAEQVPTQNYNYRYLTTLFLNRYDLTPFKMTLSSQEWCGHTFKHLRWNDAGLEMQSFSYFSAEGDRQYSRPAEAVPLAAMFVVARDVAVEQRTRRLSVLPTLRSNRQVIPDATCATLTPAEDTTRAMVPAGTFEVRRVRLESDRTSGWFDVQVEPPHQLIAYEVGDLSGRLQSVERRAYWDRGWPSTSYSPGRAP